MEATPEKETINWTSLLVFTGMLLAGMFIGNFIAFLFALPFTGFDFDILVRIIESPQLVEGSRSIMMLMQGVIAIITFIITPYFFSKYFDPTRPSDLVNFPGGGPVILLALSLLVIVLMPFNAGTVELFNPEVWPESLKGLAESISALDSQYDEMAAFFIDFDSISEFLLAIIIMSILPAIGEELVFRGYFQPYLIKLTGGAFAGIFISSLIFAAFHFQISGLLPRLILGMVFGYLYHWSGNLFIPIFGHFVNNAFSLVLAGLYKLGYIDLDIAGEIDITFFEALSSLVLAGFLFFVLRKQILQKDPGQNEELAGGI